jgi:hypothetical protein
LDPTEHHPDGITLAGWACLRTEPLVGNGAFLSLYYPFIDCDKVESPSVLVALFNILVLAISFRLFKGIKLSSHEVAIMK